MTLNATLNGFALIDKEKGVSSFFALKELKKVIDGGRGLKVGHAGTLDPIATGLLIVAFGEATKLLEYVVGQEKVYEATCVFGKVSDTFDADGEVVDSGFKGAVSLPAIKKVVQRFTGEIDQIPPKFSAKKIGGVAAYKLARAGKEVSLKSCRVTVSSIDIISFDWPVLKMRVKCSAGTYIRSLINDIGSRLGCGAYMMELRRVSIGCFNVSDACLVGDFNEGRLMSIEDCFSGFPTVDLGEDSESFDLLNRGMFVEIAALVEDVFLGKFNGKVFAVLEKCSDGSGRVKVKKRLNV